MRWDVSGTVAAYAVPGALLAVAFVIKLPLLRRAWQDPILRATALLLGIGAIVFASLPPANLHRLNAFTGIPNFAGVWVYSLLTAYCGACLWLIITWREPPSAVRRRRTRLVWMAYTAIIAGLWTTFSLGDHHVERLRDLDTYYANTPWMREFGMLYLVAHLVSALVAAGMLWAWYKEVEDTWLRRAVIFLQVAYALGLVFDVAKLAAVSARWSGRDWDWLSTYVAPPFAIAEALLVATGFIAGQAGPVVEERRRLVRTHRLLRPLWQTMLTVAAPAAPATGRVSGAALRLELRRAAINDGLLKLAPHLSRTRRERARTAALSAGHPDAEARGIAGAVDILVAADVLHAPADRAEPPAAAPEEHADHAGRPDPAARSDAAGRAVESARPDAADRAAGPGRADDDGQADDASRPGAAAVLSDSELESIAHALRLHAPVIERFRRQAAATEGLTAHA
ncbi:MAB_1171c family putative transporter [Streptomyces monashensis]|uniref:MAB_1171c family putative transporter n=1 Tax=Streptomyces monashensis TaxID=1678012 RepID=UPI000B29758A|nr:MAB_1171c family putative transporter [Streptomyces monashensis]